MRLCSTEVARSLLEQDMRSSPVTRFVLFPSPASQNIQHHINQDIRQTLSSTNHWQARSTYFQACHQYPEHNLLSGDEKKRGRKPQHLAHHAEAMQHQHTQLRPATRRCQRGLSLSQLSPVAPLKLISSIPSLKATYSSPDILQTLITQKLKASPTHPVLKVHNNHNIQWLNSFPAACVNSLRNTPHPTPP